MRQFFIFLNYLKIDLFQFLMPHMKMSRISKNKHNQDIQNLHYLLQCDNYDIGSDSSESFDSSELEETYLIYLEEYGNDILSHPPSISSISK